MKKEELYRLLENGPVYLDGATGSNLQKAGMPTGVCPEQWILDHPDVILDLQKRYIEAGTQILYCTNIYCKPYKTGRVWTGR